MPNEPTPTTQGKEQLLLFREVVGAAIGELRSQEIRDTYAAISIEELMDQHVARLEGTDDPLRPGRLQRIRKVLADLKESIAAMKATPPALFRRHDSTSDANTSPDPDESVLDAARSIP